MLITDAILLGGGRGIRFGAATLPKQFQMLGNAPVFIHAIKGLLRADCFRRIIFVVPKDFESLAKEQLQTYLGQSDLGMTPEIPVIILTGGKTRQESSRIGLARVAELPPLPTRVVIHDACRPFLSEELTCRMKECVLDRAYGAWVPVIPIVDTIKRVENHRVVESIDRSLVQRVQTPQIFEFTVIQSLAEKSKDLSGVSFTDDASLCEYYGIPVGAFEGDVRNMKLTFDFERETLRSVLEHPTEKELPCDSELATTFTS